MNNLPFKIKESKFRDFLLKKLADLYYKNTVLKIKQEALLTFADKDGRLKQALNETMQEHSTELDAEHIYRHFIFELYRDYSDLPDDLTP